MATWYNGITAGQWGTISIGTLSASGLLQSGGAGVFTAWGGAVLTETGVYNGTSFVTGPAMVAFGGGHTDYSGNELYALTNLSGDTPAYRRLRDKSSPDIANADTNGGGDPVSRHTYQTIAWVGGSNNWLFSAGYLYRATDAASSLTPHYADLSVSNPNVAQPWVTSGLTGMPGGGGTGNITVWEASSNRVWFNGVGSNQVGYYDVAGNSWTDAGSKSPSVGTNCHSALDTSRGLWFAVWSGSTNVQGFRTNNGASNDYYTVSTTGTAPASGNNKSIVYDPVDDRFVVYDGNGKQVFFLTPPATNPYSGGNAWVWSSTTPGSGTTPPTQLTNGTFGRFAYVPAPIRGYLFWNSSADEPVFFRPASASSQSQAPRSMHQFQM